MPFGAFLLFAGLLVLPRFGGRHAERADGGTAGGVFDFGICTEIAHQDDLVHAPCHSIAPRFRFDRHVSRAIMRLAVSGTANATRGFSSA